MRGPDTFTESLFCIKKLDDFVPATHPLRAIRAMVNDALSQLEDLFAGMYEDASKGGRPSIAPQKLLRAMLLQVLYSVRSERLLMEQVQYNLLFRWFIGLSMDDSVWVPTVFSKNRQRLIEHDAVVAFFAQVLAQAEQKNWLSKGPSTGCPMSAKEASGGTGAARIELQMPLGIVKSGQATEITLTPRRGSAAALGISAAC